MSLLGNLDLDVANAEEITNKPGTYKGTISGAEVAESKAGNLNLVIEYTLTGCPFPVREYFGLPRTPQSEWDETEVEKTSRAGKQYTSSEHSQNTRNVANLKRRYVSLGIPASAMNDVTADDLIDLSVVVILSEDKNNTQYPDSVRVTRVSAQGEGDTRLPTAQATATADAKTAEPTKATVNPYA